MRISDWSSDVCSSDLQTLGEEAIENLKTSLREDYAGFGAENDWMILEEGLKAKLFASSARDSQLVELMKREAEDISRFTGVPRPLLMFDETKIGRASCRERVGQYV